MLNPRTGPGDAARAGGSVPVATAPFGLAPAEEATYDRTDGSGIRRNNLKLVLHSVLTRRDSRAGIAARTGLTRATISRLVAELVGSGLLREDGYHATGQTGRPGTALAVDGRHVFGIGAEINVDHLAVLVVDLSGAIVYERRESFAARTAGPEQTISTLGQMITHAFEAVSATIGPDLAAGVARPPHLAGVAVGVAGIVDIGSGAIAYAPNLGWRNVPIAGPLGEILALPQPMAVVIGNQANAAAMAEVRFGEFAGSTDIVYIRGEVGIGGGIISGGRSLLGRRGHGSEVGHTMLSADGPECHCGRTGCWEAYIGLNVVYRAAGFDLHPETTFATVAGGGRDAGREVGFDEKVGRLAEAAGRGDEVVLAALARAGHFLGLGASNLANILSPQAVIVGGYFAPLAEWMMPAAREAYDAGAFAPSGHASELAVSTLGLSAGMLGAASMTIDPILTDPALLSSPTDVSKADELVGSRG